jgi:hypothetical protein
MSHVIGQPENQQSQDFGLYTTVVTNSTTPIEVRRFPIKIGEGGAIKVDYNAVTGEDLPRQVNRWRAHSFKRNNTDGAITLIQDMALYSRHDSGGAAVDYALSIEGDAIVVKVVGAAGIEIRHTLLVQKVSGTLHESFTI